MISDILLTLHFLIWLAISLRVLARNDFSSSARLAWIVVLFILPYVGVIVYWMFGEIHLGLEFNQRNHKIITRLQDNFSNIFSDQHHLESTVESDYRPAFAYSSSVTGFHTTVGNQAELMTDATATQQRMVADFDAAQDHIHVMYYMWLEDGMGTAIAEALIRAAKRGVQCRAMADGMGSRNMIGSELWRRMEAAGVEVSVALPIKNIIKVMLFSRIDLRNHRKITIIDGKVGYVGSRNSADPEFRIKPKYAPWVDIMVRVEGPVVAQNQMLFARDWLMQNPDTPYDSFPFITHLPDITQSTNQPTNTSIIQSNSQLDNITNNSTNDEINNLNNNTINNTINNEYNKSPNNSLQHNRIEKDVAAQVFADGPSQRQGTTPQFLSILISQAKHTLIISTPYFVPDYTLINMICATAHRGVDVTMIFPKNNDSWIVEATSHSCYHVLLDAGVKIYEYKPGLLHAKTLTVDGKLCLIGSTNLDLRSFDLNYENNVIFYDEGLTQQIVKRQFEYISDSDNITLYQVENWPLYLRIWNNIVATMGPVL